MPCFIHSRPCILPVYVTLKQRIVEDLVMIVQLYIIYCRCLYESVSIPVCQLKQAIIMSHTVGRCRVETASIEPSRWPISAYDKERNGNTHVQHMHPGCGLSYAGGGGGGAAGWQCRDLTPY